MSGSTKSVRGLNAATKRFLGGAAGATMAEYALMLALIAVVVIGAAAVLGTKISSVFEAVALAI